MEHIKTNFANDIDRACPLKDYPRPQLEREEWLCLNGEWDFAIKAKGEPAPTEYREKILVPYAPETALSGVEKHPTAKDEMWYRRTFTIPSKWKGKRIILHLGAVDYKAVVYVNGSIAVEHEGGYCPFEADITDFLIAGENTLIVNAYDPTDKGLQPRGKQTDKSHGFWYTATSGIWQTVWLEPVNKNHIKSVKLLPDIDSGELSVKADIFGKGTIKVTVIDGEDEITSAEFDSDGKLSIPNAKLWSPENPFLYSLRIEMISAKRVVDTVKSYFGMRKFSIEKDYNGLPRLCLNNKPYFQRGLLDQGYHPDGGMTAPTDEAMIYDIATMKSLGFNMLRKHIKREPDRWYYHCDRLGMLVWQDMISGSDYVSAVWCGICPNLNITGLDDGPKNYWKFKRTDSSAREQFKKELWELIDGLYNSTSICCWVPFNESWGQFDAKEIGTAVKNADPSRFVDHASGWHDQGGPDFVSIHKYILPVTLPKLDGERPFVLSEYGGYSMTIDNHVWDKLKSFGYMMFKSKQSLTNAFVKLHEKQIIPLIDKGLSATVYTQVSDVEFEVNGLLTYDRKLVKLDEDAVKKVIQKLHY